MDHYLLHLTNFTNYFSFTDMAKTKSGLYFRSLSSKTDEQRQVLLLVCKVVPHPKENYGTFQPNPFFPKL